MMVLAKADVGLGNVDNTTDEAKPVSTAQATAIGNAQTAAQNASTPIAHVGTGGTAHADVVDGGASGFMTGADKTKLDAITGTNTGDQILPTLASLSAVGLADVQTLTNKTLTSPVVNTPTITGTKETKVAVAASSIDLSTGNFFTKTAAGALTWTVTNIPAAGTTVSLILDLTNGGSGVQTWWTGMKWAGGTAPTLTAAGRDVLGFFTHDGGTTWTGLVLGKDVK
jgi:hypothetical protein